MQRAQVGNCHLRCRVHCSAQLRAWELLCTYGADASMTAHERLWPSASGVSIPVVYTQAQCYCVVLLAPTAICTHRYGAAAQLVTRQAE
jgi:hypothetical protein